MQPTINSNKDVYVTPNSSSQPPVLNPIVPYYVVSKVKFFALFILSFSLYAIYWNYKNWSIWKHRNNEDIWPIARAIFYVFYTHSLFEKIHVDAEHVSSKKLDNLKLTATVFVISQVGISIVDKFLPDDPMTPSVIALIVSLGISAWALWKAQNQANIASLDIAGNQNNKLTPKNYIVLVLGGILWLLILSGLVLEVMNTNIS